MTLKTPKGDTCNSGQSSSTTLGERSCTVRQERRASNPTARGAETSPRSHCGSEASSLSIWLFCKSVPLQRNSAGSGTAAWEPHKPQRAAAGEGTLHRAGVPLPQQKQLQQGARGAAVATDEESRSWESPMDLFSLKHLLSAGLGLVFLLF